jgi:uncharacterized protein
MRMRIAVTGGTGYIGSALVDALVARGDEVVIITRRVPPAVKQRPDAAYATWEEAAVPGVIGRVDAVVNLAGESINQRWNAAGKARIVESRVRAAAGTAALIAAQPVKPRVVIQASGISIYGSSETSVFDETSDPKPGADDFLAQVVLKWEEAAKAIDADRVVKLRIGVVIDGRGGAFPLMALPYKLFVGGRIGSGRQWLPWIHLEDMVRLILFSLDTDGLSGVINACAPEAVTNDQFGRAIARAFRRPHWFPLPSIVFQTAFGEMSALLLKGQHVVPRRALEAGFTYRYPTVNEALQAIAQQ